MQIPGVDYTESFSPVCKDSTIRTSFEMVLWNMDWIFHYIDVEASFLNPKLDRHIYIEWPDGTVELGFITEEEKGKYCIKLVRSMYGNFDAARQWMKMVDECIKRDLIKVTSKSKTDPFMY